MYRRKYKKIEKYEIKNTKFEKFRLKFYSASLILTIIFNIIININNYVCKPNILCIVHHVIFS